MSTTKAPPKSLPSADGSARVPHGCKRTDAGVIPKDWDAKQLKDIADFTNGKPHERNIAPDGRYQLITLDSIGIDGKLKSEHKPVSVYDHSLQRNDIVAVLSDLAHGNLLGLCDLIPADDTYVLNQRVGRLRLNTVADPRFVQLQINRRQDHFRKRGQGTSQLHIYRRDFDSLWIPFPSEPEQHAIAEALSDVDGLIGALDNLITKKQAIKRAAIQQLLTGTTRLSGFSGEWEVMTLEHVVDCLDNLRVPLNETQRANMQGPYPYCGANGVLDYVNDYVLDDDVILIAEDGGYFDEFAHRPIAYRMSGKIWVNNHAHILKAKAGFSQGFLFYSLVHKNILPYLASGTRAKLNKAEMNKIEVSLPRDKKEQESISVILSDMDVEIAALERHRDKTKQIKQGMTQSLLTGRVRLVKPKGTI